MRDKVLNVALSEFTTYGYRDVSINRIAGKSGYSKQLIFHYFKNKKELFLMMIRYFSEIFKNECISKIRVSEKDLIFMDH